MIDGIKFRLPKKYIPIFLANPLLDPEGKYKLKNGQGIPDKFRIEYKCFTIYLYKEVIRIRGSIHKYAQRGTNYDNFDFRSIKRALHQLSEELEFDLEDAILENVEIGINLPTTFKVDEWLRFGVIVYKYIKPVRTQNHKSKGYYIEFRAKKYWRIKIYDKGSQYGLDQNILRLEKRFDSNSEIYKRLGIKLLSDLIRENVYSLMLAELQDTLDKLITIDDLKFDTVKNLRDKELLTKCCNSSYWETITNASTRKKLKHRFKQICTTHKLNQKVNEISNSLPVLWGELVNLDTNTPLSKGARKRWPG